MKIFIDTAEIEEIKPLVELGLVDGVTTNPSLILKSGRYMIELNGITRFEVTKEICDLVDGPVSAEVASTDYKTMVEEAVALYNIADNVCLKVPMTPDGLKTCKYFSDQGKMVNVTLCFSAAQALLAAKAGASFISPFVGRHDDVGQSGMALIEEIRIIYDNYNFDTEILVASTRHNLHIIDSALIGADVATIPPKLVHQLFKHPLTDSGLAAFVADWEKTGQSITD